MIDRTHKLPVIRQCEILELARSTAYYTAKPTSAADLALMSRMDELHLDYPFAGSRMLRDLLRKHGGAVDSAAKEAGMNVATLYRKIKRYGLRKEEYAD